MIKKNKLKRQVKKMPGAQPNSQHPVFVNKKTGKASSRNNGTIAATARAITNDDDSGIAGLLFQDEAIVHQAKGLLEHNRPVMKEMRGLKGKLASKLARDQAKQMIPMLDGIYRKQLASHKPLRKGEFCIWIVKALQDRNSRAREHADNHGCDELIDAEPGWRWWRDQLEKKQS